MLGISAIGRLSHSQLHAASGYTRATLDGALDELLAEELIVGDRSSYTLCHEGFARWLSSHTDRDQSQQLHDQLARMHQESGGDALLVAHHLLAGSTPAQGVSVLLAAAPDVNSWEPVLNEALLQTSVDVVARTLEAALESAEQTQCSAAERLLLQERLAHMSSLGEDPKYYFRVREACLARYQHDSGYEIWKTLDPQVPAKARAEQAIGAAFARYADTPVSERVLSPSEAIKALARWVAISIPVASRTLDADLVSTLPGLIEPFASVSPLLSVMTRNVTASRLFRCEGRVQDARELWAEVLHSLESDASIDMAYIVRVRTALCVMLAGVDAFLGIPSNWVDRLSEGEHDPLQLAQIHDVRKMAALSEGDWEHAEQHRRQADRFRLRTNMVQSLSMLGFELWVHAAARDLTGLRRVRQGIHVMADQYPAWMGIKHLADAIYAKLCGELHEALNAAQRSIDDGHTRFPHWQTVPHARVVLIEVLLELGRVDEAFTQGTATLQRYRAGRIHHAARDLERALALAEARLGLFRPALDRISRVITEQRELGISGLQLGLSYQTAARIAIQSRDAETFRAYAGLAEEYFQPGRSAVLGALYERLHEEARAAGLSGKHFRTSVATQGETRSSPTRLLQHEGEVASSLNRCRTPYERAHVALNLLCNEYHVTGGHLFLLTEQGLECVASTEADPRLEGGLSFVASFLAAEVERAGEEDCDELPTMTLRELAAAVARIDWISGDGAPYSAVALCAMALPSVRFVGAALLQQPESPVTVTLRAGVASELAEAFLQHGDAPGALVAHSPLVTTTEDRFA